MRTRVSASRKSAPRTRIYEAVAQTRASSVRRAAARPMRCLYDVGPATPAMELRGDQLGELGRNVCHRLFHSAQTASRAEQGANFAESFICRAVHDWNEQVTR